MPKNSPIIFFLLYMTILFFGNTLISYGTDLKINSFRFPVINYQDEDIPVKIEIENANVLAANKYNLLFSVSNFQNTIIKRDTLRGDTIKPFTKMIYDFDLKADFNPGRYKLNLYIDFNEDINYSNNSATEDLILVHNYSNIKEMVLNYISANIKPPVTNYVNAYLASIAFDTNVRISSFNESELMLPKATNPFWFSWIDYNKYAGFSHKTEFLRIDGFSGEITSHFASWWPKISLPNFEPFDSMFRIYGSLPFDTTNTSNTVVNPGSSSPRDSICFLMVTGWDERQSMRDAWKNNTEMIMNNFKNERYGPRLPGTAFRIEHGISGDSLKKILKSMKNKYKKIYFYYAGHGTDNNEMCTGDSFEKWLNYNQFFEELFDTEAPDISLFFEDCYSGQAIDAAKNDIRYKDRNIEIITVSSKDRVSYAYPSDSAFKGYSVYTYHFVQCFGQSNADKNKDSITSFKETFDWVRNVNPDITSLGKLDTLQKPQFATFERQPGDSVLKKIAEFLQNLIEDSYNEQERKNSKAYLTTDTLKIGSTVRSFDSTEFKLSVGLNYHFGWLDHDKYAGYSHSTEYFLVKYDYDLKAVDTSKTVRIKANWWPVIDGFNAFNYSFYEPDSVPKIASNLDSLISISTGDSTNGSRICALVLSGSDERAEIQDGIDWSVNNYKWYLTKNPFGPRLPETSVRVEKNVNGDSLIKILQSMKGKYDKIYISYQGHGSDSGMICTNGRWVTYNELFKELYNTGASDIFGFFDCCFSGLAVNGMRSDPRFKTRNIELITATSGDRVGWFGAVYDNAQSKYLWYLNYSHAFLFAGVDPLADENNDSLISLNEAYHKVLKDNPIDIWGRKLDTLFRPTKTVVTAEPYKGADQPIERVDLDLTITPKISISYTPKFLLSLNYPVGWQPNYSDSVSNMKTYRYWNIQLDTNVEDLNLDLEFRYRSYLDDRDSTNGFIGIVTRDNSTEPFKPYLPVIIDWGRNIIKALNVNHFSDWAFARIKNNPTGISDEIFTEINFEMMPNPAADYATIKFSLETASDISIDLMSLTGNKLGSIINSHFDNGTYSTFFSVANLSSGIYIIKLTINGINSFEKLIISK